MKLLKIIFIISILNFVLACTNTSTHPLLRQQADLMATEIRVNIYVADDIQEARINNYPLKNGTNYIKVPFGKHILYWSKKGVTNTKELEVSKVNNKFLLY